jgi:hypothetical protein
MKKPVDGYQYRIFGTHTWGDWDVIATAKYYSEKNPKALSKYQRKYGYRWIAKNGNVIKPHEVERFELLYQGDI